MSGTILLADDSLTIQKVVELTFADTDYRVVAVSSGDELIERLGDSQPDLIICDEVTSALDPLVERATTVEVNGKRFDVSMWVPDAPLAAAAAPARKKKPVKANRIRWPPPATSAPPSPAWP